MQSSDNTGVIPFTVDFSDMANNAGTQVTAVANDQMEGLHLTNRLPRSRPVTMSSNNSTSTLAIVNDVITINLTSDEAIKAGSDPTITVNGNTQP